MLKYWVKWVVNGIVHERSFSDFTEARAFYIGIIFITKLDNANQNYRLIVDFRNNDGHILLNYYYDSNDKKGTGFNPITL